MLVSSIEQKKKVAQLKLARIKLLLASMDTGVSSQDPHHPDYHHWKKKKLREKISKMFPEKELMKLASQYGKYAKYWVLNAKDVNGNGWGVNQSTIEQNIQSFKGKPFVITAKEWIPNSEYEDTYDHPYIGTNDLQTILQYQARFRVGIIDEIIKHDNGDYFVKIAIDEKFQNRTLPPFCSPAIYMLNPHEPDNNISSWMGLHLAGLMENPAYGPRVAILRGVCSGTAGQCSHQFRGAKQTRKCSKYDGNCFGYGKCTICGEPFTKEMMGKKVNNDTCVCPIMDRKAIKLAVKLERIKESLPPKQRLSIIKSKLAKSVSKDKTKESSKQTTDEIKGVRDPKKRNQYGEGYKSVKQAVLKLKSAAGRFEESKHPRDKGGQFTCKSCGGNMSSEDEHDSIHKKSGEKGGKPNKERKERKPMKTTEGQDYLDSLDDMKKRNVLATVLGVKPKDVDIGMSYDDLDKWQKKTIDSFAGQKDKEADEQKNRLEGTEPESDEDDQERITREESDENRMKDDIGDKIGTISDMEESGYGPNTFRIETEGGEEYLAFNTPEDARQAAIEQVKNSFDEMGAEGFNKDFIDNYYTFDDEPMKREIAMEQAEADREIYEQEADDDGLKGNEREQLIEKRVEDRIEEVEQMLNDDPMGYFTELGYEPEEARKKFFSIDVDKMAEDAVDTDGVGHFLAGYDGEEVETKDGRLLYRTN